MIAVSITAKLRRDVFVQCRAVWDALGYSYVVDDDIRPWSIEYHSTRSIWRTFDRFLMSEIPSTEFNSGLWWVDQVRDSLFLKLRWVHPE